MEESVEDMVYRIACETCAQEGRDLAELTQEQITILMTGIRTNMQIKLLIEIRDLLNATQLTCP